MKQNDINLQKCVKKIIFFLTIGFYSINMLSTSMKKSSSFWKVIESQWLVKTDTGRK